MCSVPARRTLNDIILKITVYKRSKAWYTGYMMRNLDNKTKIGLAVSVGLPIYMGIATLASALAEEAPREPDHVVIMSEGVIEPSTTVSDTVDYTPMVYHYNDTNRRLYQETNIISEISEDVTDREELLCMAINIYHEARGSTTEDQIAVAEVVKNRTADWRWPDTVCDVVWDNKQFSWTHDGLSDMPREDRAWETSQYIAWLSLNNMVENPVGNANHYHTTEINPYWSVSARQQVGSHFYMEM